MIDHGYKIITREVTKTSSQVKRFVVELSQIYIIIDGKRIQPQFPQQAFFGKTQAAAMIQASDTLRHWLKRHYATL